MPAFKNMILVHSKALSTAIYLMAISTVLIVMDPIVYKLTGSRIQVEHIFLYNLQGIQVYNLHEFMT